MNKLLIALLSTILFTGCSTIDPMVIDAVFPNPKTYGYNPGDPCIKCGESFVFIQNEEFAAQNQRRAEIEAQNAQKLDPQ
jgi:hypothetical protein